MLRRRCPTCARVFAGSERFCAHDAAELVDVEVEDARVGSVLAGRYRLGERLGQGGMGVVYRAEQLPMERPVALKILARDGDATSAARFMREARAMSALQSPHSVRLYDFGEAEDGSLYLVMELLVGESLRQHLARGPLPVAEAVAVLGEVARSLAEAHLQGIVHRDLTPANVFLCDAPGQPRFAKVLDFGIAAIPWEGSAQLTRTSELPGTPAYVAPERVSGEGAGPAADVYALGVLAYEMLTGAPPFAGESAWDVLMAHLSDEPAPLAERVPAGVAVPVALEELVWRCLAKAPELRPADASAFRDALAEVAGDLEAKGAAEQRPPARSAPSRRRRGIAIAAAVLAGAVGGWVARGPEAPPPAVVAPAEAETAPSFDPVPVAPRLSVGAAPAARRGTGDDDDAPGGLDVGQAPAGQAAEAQVAASAEAPKMGATLADPGDEAEEPEGSSLPGGEGAGEGPAPEGDGEEPATADGGGEGATAPPSRGGGAAPRPARARDPRGGEPAAEALDEGDAVGPDPALIERLLGDPAPR